MTPLWDVSAGCTPGSFKFNRVSRVVGLVCLVILGTGVPGLAATQDERVFRRIVVADHQTAEEILQQVRQGASFSALARAKSTGAEYSQWGYSGVVHLNQVQPALRAALLNLQEGQVSDVLEFDSQFV